VLNLLISEMGNKLAVKFRLPFILIYSILINYHLSLWGFPLVFGVLRFAEEYESCKQYKI